MKRKRNQIMLTTAFISSLFVAAVAQNKPPLAPSQPVTETYFGKQVIDPYRNLENLSDSTVENWYRQQAAYAKEQLKRLPHQDTMMQEILSNSRLMNNSRTSIHFSDNYVIYGKMIDKASGSSEIRMIDNKSGQDILLLRSKDPALWDTSQYRPFALHISPDEQYLCLSGIKMDGSDFQCQRFFHISTRKLLSDTVFEEFMDWMPDSRSIAVRVYPHKDVKSDSLYFNLSTEIYRLGQKKLTDVLSTSSASHLKLDPGFFNGIITNPSSSYAVGWTGSSSAYFNTIYFAPVSDYTKMGTAWKAILLPDDSVTITGMPEPVTDFKLYGNYIYYISSVSNSNYTLNRVQIPSGKKELIVSDREKIVHDFAIANNRLYYILRHGLQCQLFSVLLSDLRNHKSVSLPKDGFARINATADNKTILLNINSWIGETTQYMWNDKEKKWNINPINTKHKFPWDGKIESKEVWVKARDGVVVPLTLIYPTDLKLDGQNPVLLSGYGSYGYPLFPFMNPLNLFTVSKGVVVAIAHVRGGGELGNKWHLAGMKETKANTWNDFIDCAEWLISNRYTSTNRLIAEGASAGGILVGKTITERPDLFCAAIIKVGFLNSARIAFTPNSINQYEEFGNPAIEEEFNHLCQMDAYLHIKENTSYPAAYITAGWNDPSVIVWQPGKFAARLQNSSTSGKPVYLAINFDAGHSGSLNPTNFIAEFVEKTAFEFQQWKFDPYEKR